MREVDLDEAKRFVIVSNNDRNQRLRDVLGVRLTTADKPSIPSIVEFRPGEIADPRSSAVADDIWLIHKDRLKRQVGALNQGQMRKVDDALRAALALG